MTRTTAVGVLVIAITSLLAGSALAQQEQAAGQQQEQQKPDTPPPSFCSSQPFPSYTTSSDMQRGGLSYKSYSNIWYHNGKWYALVDETVNASQIEEGVSVNVGAIKLPVTDIVQYTKNFKTCYVPGNTLLVDFPFPAFPDNLGHLIEVMAPMYSVLEQGEWKSVIKGESKHIDRILLANLRLPLIDWFKEVIAITVAPAMAHPGKMPEMVEQASVEEFEKLGWLTYENLIVIQDRYTHPKRLTGFTAPDHGDMWRHAEGCARYVSSNWTIGFFAPELAHSFRDAAYDKADWPLTEEWAPGQPPPLPRIITYLKYPEGNPDIVNEGELLDMLHEVAASLPGWRMRTVSLTMEAPFVSHLATMAESGVVVARHGPILANAVFLPPGAVVMELLPYKWEWQQISRLYYNTTQSMGYIHHFAWRPMDKSFCEYTDAGDARYSSWTYEECYSRECLVVHARAGLKVDVAAVRATLMVKLPRVLAGESVDSLRDEWPSA